MKKFQALLVAALLVTVVNAHADKMAAAKAKCEKMTDEAKKEACMKKLDSKMAGHKNMDSKMEKTPETAPPTEAPKN